MAAELPNKQHERFARLLAGGVKQREAYARAGYASANNRAAASRLAKKVAARVSELRNEEAARIFSNMDRGAGGAISDLGITPEWIAEQYRIIAARSRAEGDYRTSSAAVHNIEKLVRAEMKAEGGDAPKKSDGPKIDVGHMLSILAKFGLSSAPADDDHKQPAKDSDEVGMLARNRAHRAAARDEQ